MTIEGDDDDAGDDSEHFSMQINKRTANAN